MRRGFPIFADGIWALRKGRLIGFFSGRARLCGAARRKQSAPQSIALPAEERKDQTQHDANNDAGDDWEIECAAAAFDADVAGKSSEKARADASPKNYSDHDNDNANND